jgi:hypothetical protein
MDLAMDAGLTPKRSLRDWNPTLAQYVGSQMAQLVMPTLIIRHTFLDVELS